MKKLLFLCTILALLALLSCSQPAEEEKIIENTDTITIEATGDAAVDSVGQDISGVDDVADDLNSDELADIDSGLSDIENI